MTPGNHPSSVSWGTSTIPSGAVVAGDRPTSSTWTGGNTVGGSLIVYLTTDDGYFITTNDGYRILLERIAGNDVTIGAGNHPSLVTW